jgi:hypothetical protein
MMFVRVYPRETQEMVFDAHDRAFALFIGKLLVKVAWSQSEATRTFIRFPGP